MEIMAASRPFSEAATSCLRSHYKKLYLSMYHDKKSMRSVLVSVVVPNPVLRIFVTFLISPLGNQIKVLIGGIHHIDSSRKAGVGVKNRAALVFVEHAGSLPVHRSGISSCIVVEGASIVGFLGDT